MPLLFSLVQHASLEALQRKMRPTEKLLAHLDVHFASKPEWVGDVVATNVQELCSPREVTVPELCCPRCWVRAETLPTRGGRSDPFIFSKRERHV